MTSAVKHTVGPWVLNGECGEVITGDGENAVICDIFGSTVSDEEDKANLRLIAAAPDMLAMLVECRKQIDCIIEDGVQTDWRDWREDIDDLLARATPTTSLKGE